SGLHAHHQPVHPERPADQRPADRQGGDHRRRRAAAAPRAPLAHLTPPSPPHPLNQEHVMREQSPRQQGPRPSRRHLLLGGAALAAGGLAAACTSNTEDGDSGGGNPQAGTLAGDNDKAGKQVTIGFSAPAADHGWIAAIAKNAEEQAKKDSDVTFKPVEPTNDINQQISAVESLIEAKVDVLVILPNDGEQLNQVGRKAMDAGVPVVNLDRV